MNRTERAKVRAAHQALNMARAFKNDAISETVYSYTFRDNSKERIREEKLSCKIKQKQLRRLKKYVGYTGGMSESGYKEFMGA